MKRAEVGVRRWQRMRERHERMDRWWTGQAMRWLRWPCLRPRLTVAAVAACNTRGETTLVDEIGWSASNRGGSAGFGTDGRGGPFTFGSDLAGVLQGGAGGAAGGGGQPKPVSKYCG